MFRTVFVICLSTGLLAGCAAPVASPTEAPEPQATHASGVDPWPATGRLLVSHEAINAFGMQEFDLLCTMGGTAYYAFEMLHAVPADTDHLEITVANGLTTGLQAGWATGEEITWTTVVTQGRDTFTVATDGIDPASWSFHYQLNIPAEQDCYTGVGMGGWFIDVVAVREPGQHRTV